MSKMIRSYIIFNSHPAGSVDGDAPAEGVMDGVGPDDRFLVGDVKCLVEVNGVRS